MLVVQCLVIFAGAPFVALGYSGSGVAMELLLIVFAFLVVAVSRRRITTIVAIVAMITTVAGSFLSLITPSASTMLLAYAGTMTGTVVVGYIVGGAVFASGAVTQHRILGAIVLYLDFGLICATAYRLIWELVPHSFSGIPAGATSYQASGTIVYFSFVTLTTTGFGDIIPIHPFARSLANLEGVIGQLYPATLLARLITLELQARRG